MTNTDLPFISVIIPCRNEAGFIDKCLDSIISQDYPKNRMEIIIVDGGNGDETKRRLSEYVSKYSFIRVLDNPDKKTPFAMNIGIKNATGDIIMTVNAHAALGINFLKYVSFFSEKTEADGVGGTLKSVSVSDFGVQQAIMIAVQSAFGSGGKRYKTRKEEGFIFDTLPYAAYKKNVFQKYGFIDEDLQRDQDEEFNYRILKNGGKLFFSPKIKSCLYVRPSIGKLWLQHFQYGYFKPLVVLKTGFIFTWRQMLPAAFVSSLIITGLLSLLFNPFLWIFLAILCSYLVTNLLFSFLLSLKNGLRYFFILPAVFFILHVSYGLGYLKGVFDFMIIKKHKKDWAKDLPLTR